MSEITLLGPDYIQPVNYLGLYSDNTPWIKLPDLDVMAVDTMVLRHSDTLQFVTAMFIVDSIREQGGRIEKLIIPYLPGARQDRVNPTGDILFAAKGFADMLNAREFSRVITLDPHSNVMFDLIDNCETYHLWHVAEKIGPWADESRTNRKYTAVIAPDKGAADRAETFGAWFNIPVISASKQRDVSTGALSGFQVDVEPGRYLVVDDICDGGGTFVGLGEKIMEQGAIADLYVTHGLFAKGTRRLRELYREIYTTDSVFQHNANRVNVIPVLERMKQL
jgi:ribose-phosphate pyrophosphokinase